MAEIRYRARVEQRRRGREPFTRLRRTLGGKR